MKKDKDAVKVRARLLAIARRIRAFEVQCEQEEYTDTDGAWALLLDAAEAMEETVAVTWFWAERARKGKP